MKVQHLKDALASSNRVSKTLTLSKITSYVSLLLSGKVPACLAPFILSAPVIPLKKKDGGIRPIAIGEIWRRVTSKVASRYVKEKVKNYLSPYQVGVGVPNGAEGIIHSVERIIREVGDEKDLVMLKVDFTNAFNLVNRDVFLDQVQRICPEILPWVVYSYSQAAVMYAGDTTFTCSQSTTRRSFGTTFIFFGITTTDIGYCKEFPFLNVEWLVFR